MKAQTSISVYENLLFLGLLVWLTIITLTLKVEYYDGIDAILNIRRFTGESNVFITNRAPLISILLIPADLIHNILKLDAFDFRPYHITMGILHFAYLLVVYRMLVITYGRNASVLLAFFSAVTSFMFFSYAPFISHDILPGALLLAMLLLAERYRQNPSIDIWLLLVFLGACAALIKHIYGLFWFALLFSHAVIPFFTRESLAVDPIKNWLHLFFGALTSGLITWICLAWALSQNSDYLDIPFILMPIKQLHFLTNVVSRTIEFPWWVYLRNLPAFGLLAISLLAFGLATAFRGNPLQKTVALSFVFILIFMHIVPSREVRYLVPLSPLIAFLIIPIIKNLIQKQSGKVLIFLLLFLTTLPSYPYSLTSEATRFFHSFYQTSPYEAALSPLYKGKKKLAPLIINWQMLSFSDDTGSPLAGDRYHLLFHFAKHHLYMLMGYRPDELIYLKGASYRQLGNWPDRSALIVTDGPASFNSSDWKAVKNSVQNSVLQTTLVAENITLFLQPDSSYESKDGINAQLLTTTDREDHKTFIQGHNLVNYLHNAHIMRIENKVKKNTYKLKLAGNDRLEIVDYYDTRSTEPEKSLTIHAFIAKSYY